MGIHTQFYFYLSEINQGNELLKTASVSREGSWGEGLPLGVVVIFPRFWWDQDEDKPKA